MCLPILNAHHENHMFSTHQSYVYFRLTSLLFIYFFNICLVSKTWVLFYYKTKFKKCFPYHTGNFQHAQLASWLFIGHEHESTMYRSNLFELRNLFEFRRFQINQRDCRDLFLCQWIFWAELRIHQWWFVAEYFKWRHIERQWRWRQKSQTKSHRKKPQTRQRGKPWTRQSKKGTRAWEAKLKKHWKKADKYF